MKTSTIVFNVAAVITMLGVCVALVDLMRHKTKSYGVTEAPTVAPTPTPGPVLGTTS